MISINIKEGSNLNVTNYEEQREQIIAKYKSVSKGSIFKVEKLEGDHEVPALKKIKKILYGS